MATTQFALYPLRVEQPGPAVDAALAAVQETGLAVEAGRMSTTLAGTDAEVFAAPRAAFDVAAQHGEVMIFATVLNAHMSDAALVIAGHQARTLRSRQGHADAVASASRESRT